MCCGVHIHIAHIQTSTPLAHTHNQHLQSHLHSHPRSRPHPTTSRGKKCLIHVGVVYLWQTSQRSLQQTCFVKRTRHVPSELLINLLISLNTERTGLTREEAVLSLLYSTRRGCLGDGRWEMGKGEGV
jgi:hypothetical protein